eukprot:CAMPEP_0170524510 /NCGR_PEP_ID=MMETSP0209-20121228/9957_1 /TAXON_ID=665100 ORGANISM="Litonotus pictus, Strain P1" /NCGR_SAMPLE_ID=MMETSP0209 /ASSEMBLY_ACC=CAM_ASM_000301 /LENGTH=240 /DNA_ID=CAMNT_0010813227 /DNA_START=49 /DNA_END=768 /DNA_ORIENTATION=+
MTETSSNKNKFNYFQINTDKIYLNRKKDQSSSFYISTVTLQNNTDKYLLFKVYINKQKIYSTNPSTSFILPNDKIDVIIKRQETNEESLSGDIFMFSAYPVEETITDVDHAKKVLDKDKMKNLSQSLYLEATFDKNYQHLLGRSNIDDRDKGLFSSQIVKTPTTELEMKQAIQQINKESDEYNSYIEKIKVQISNFQNNSSDYAKKRTALGDKVDSKGPFTMNLSLFVFFLTLGLIVGAW